MALAIPKPGDMIKFERGTYYHYGVCVGEDEMVHFAPADGSSEINSLNSFSAQATARVKLDTISRVVSNCKYGAHNYLDNKPGYEPRAPHEICQFAREQVKRYNVCYNLIMNNCEKFAIWCRYRKENIGNQAEKGLIAAAVGIGAVIGGIGIAVATAKGGNNKKIEDDSKNQNKKAIKY